MKPLILLLVSLVLFLIGLGGTPFQTYSHNAVGIITNVQSYQRPDGNYVCDLLISYNVNSFTLLHQVPLHTVSRTDYTFGQTLTIYYNPSDPRTISTTPYVPANRLNLFFVLIAMAIALLLARE